MDKIIGRYKNYIVTFVNNKVVIKSEETGENPNEKKSRTNIRRVNRDREDSDREDSDREDNESDNEYEE